MSERELGWLAGILDGEGCIELTHTREWTLRCSIGNTNVLMMRRLSQLTGSNYYERRFQGNAKPFYVLTIRSSILRELLPLLLPSLVAKAEQAKLAVRALEILKIRRGQGRSFWGKRYGLTELESIRSQLQVLNKKGRMGVHYASEGTSSLV